MKVPELAIRRIQGKHQQFIQRLNKHPTYVYIGRDVADQAAIENHQSSTLCPGVFFQANRICGCVIKLVDTPGYIRFCDTENYLLDLDRVEAMKRTSEAHRQLSSAEETR